MAKKSKSTENGFQKLALYFAIGFSCFILPIIIAAAVITLIEKPSLAFAQSNLVIERGVKPPVFYQVEVAVSPAQHEQGLMFRRSMPQNSGMLFVYRQPQEEAFWMKNTYIPLDMLFIGSNGRITKIAAQTRPLDLTMVRSDGPVIGVLELNGGEAARQGIKVGHKIRSEALKL